MSNSRKIKLEIEANFGNKLLVPWRTAHNQVDELESENKTPNQENTEAMPPRKLARNCKSLEELEKSMHACRECSLGDTRLNAVFGRGNPEAELLLIGEAPGAEEDKTGKAFVGRGGKLLDNMLQWIDLDSNEDVFICNVLKCRPPKNRDPRGEEVVKCNPYLKRQIELVKPKVIALMGRFAMQSTLDSDLSLANLRGQVHRYKGIPAIVVYHPAYLLRNPPAKTEAAKDWKLVKKVLNFIQSGKTLPRPGPDAIVAE
jgi:DNA polymerase